ncbi:MAG: 2-dehydropantoate 2-reductase [Beijerinckiaceae bacterium]
MKICIYGAGAIGGYIGVMLKRAGADVSLVARGSHLEAINQNGLKLQIKGEELSAEIPASSNPADLGPQDYVHHRVEGAPGLGSRARNDAAPRTEHGRGHRAERLPWWYFYGIEGQYANRRIESVDPGGRQWDAIGPERVIGCTVYPATEVIAPGIVKHIDGDKFGLGEPNRAKTERTEKLSQLFASAGLKAPILPEIRNDIWLKFWGNLCFNPISVLTRATLDILATDPGTRALRRINGAARVGAHRTSMLQGLERGRPPELDAMLTSVQELGRLVKLDTPHIDAVLALTQQLGRTMGLYPTFPEEVSQREVDEARVD